MSNETDRPARSVGISVVVCTHNPRRDLLARVLGAIGKQTMASTRFELIVVDNRSSPPLEAELLSQLAGRAVRLVREARPGLTFARAAGFAAAAGEIVAFVDDDNVIVHDYLAQAEAIASAHPDVGVFGGRCRAVYERPVGRIKARFAPYLGIRDDGDVPIIGSGRMWGPHEPIGAGIVVRAPVGAGYVAYIERQSHAAGMGRTGKALMSGEDSFLSRIADILGYRVGYFPQLGLDHVIAAGRLNYRYLARLMVGHGRSYVVLHEIVSGEKLPTFSRFPVRLFVKDVLYLLKNHDPPDAVIKALWQYGYFSRCMDPSPPPPALAAILDAQSEKEPDVGVR